MSFHERVIICAIVLLVIGTFLTSCRWMFEAAARHDNDYLITASCGTAPAPKAKRPPLVRDPVRYDFLVMRRVA